ncbi:coniferyl alcohol acyltransferase-like [Miscanthus floridulus]|uniref:coniferyl alcohol acyltransferase-like n=1 Tax=Miscanthus floridulus TaxID=154761 RepID=UPI00345A0469
MANVHGCKDFHVRVVSRRLVMAFDTTIEPHVVAVSNLDLLPQTTQVAMFCLYPKPRATMAFDAVVATFEAGLATLLNHYFLLAGRIATNLSSGLPEVHCSNQGAELVGGEATGAALASLNYAEISASLRMIQLSYGDDVALSVQVVAFSCGGFTVAWSTNHLLPNLDRSVLRPRPTPSYSADDLNEAFTAVDARSQVNVLTCQQSFVERQYYVDASDIAWLREEASRNGRRATRVQAVSAYLWKALAGVVGVADAHCRMGWWVDGRPSSPLRGSRQSCK